jgi:hypothetical protein
MQLGLGLRLCLFAGVRVVSAPSSLTVMRTNPVDGAYRVKGNALQLWNETTEAQHGFFPDGPEGAVRSGFTNGDVSAADADANMTTSWLNGSWRVKDKAIQFWNATTAMHHAIFPDGPADAPRTTWGPGDNSASDPDTNMYVNDPDALYRVVNGYIEIKNPTALQFHALWLEGLNGAVREVWSVGRV